MRGNAGFLLVGGGRELVDGITREWGRGEAACAWEGRRSVLDVAVMILGGGEAGGRECMRRATCWWRVAFFVLDRGRDSVT